MVCDFIQYRQNFRDTVELRRVEPWNIEAGSEDSDGQTWEIAIDLRRAKPDAIEASIKQSFADGADGARLPLEDWRPGSKSLIWGFNSLYWKALSLWEQATGKGYESALPGGQSDARNVEAARELILELFELWDDLADRRALPEELYVLEIGVGNGNQARGIPRRIPPTESRKRPRLLPSAALLDGRLLAPRAGSRAQERGAPRGARQQPGAGCAAADRDARLPPLQGLPGVHLERLRQPAD